MSLPVIVGGVISLLLSIIAYFLHLLVMDIRQLKADQVELREFCVWLKAEQKNTRQWMQTRVMLIRKQFTKKFDPG